MQIQTHPVRVLMEEADPVRRCAAHLELGRRAITRDDIVAAADHFREAVDLDPTDERPRAALMDLEGVRSESAQNWRQTVFGWLWKSGK